mgnify:FL=1
MESSADRAKDDLRARIRQALDLADGPMTKSALAKAAGGNKAAVLRAVDLMVRDEEVENLGHGYQLRAAATTNSRSAALLALEAGEATP